jgi:aspartyl/glutamyl-tRNA(Asn/Gln) amidotransferase C subunit
MDITEIHRLGGLARIELTDEEAEGFARDVSKILGYVSEVSKITGDISPDKVPGVLVNVMRDDEEPHEAGIYTEDLLKTAPLRRGAYIEVKKILDN